MPSFFSNSANKVNNNAPNTPPFTEKPTRYLACLPDTGANFSCMPMTIAKKLGLPLKDGKFSTHTVSGGRGSSHQTQLEIMGVKSNWVVMDDVGRASVSYSHSPTLRKGEWNADAPALLGNDYQIKHGACMDLGKKEYRLTHPKTKEVRVFKVTICGDSGLPIVKLPIHFLEETLGFAKAGLKRVVRKSGKKRW